MAGEVEDAAVMPDAERPGVRFPRMFTPSQVREILNVGMPTVYGLLASGELRGVQLGGRRMWRVSEEDLAAYLERAYTQTQDRIASGTLEAVPEEG